MRPRSIAASAFHGPSACSAASIARRHVVGGRVDGGADDLAGRRVRDVEAPALALDPLAADRHAGSRSRQSSPSSVSFGSKSLARQSTRARETLPDRARARREGVGWTAQRRNRNTGGASCSRSSATSCEGQPRRAGRRDRHGHRVRRSRQVARRQPDHADHRHDRRRRLQERDVHDQRQPLPLRPVHQRRHLLRARRGRRVLLHRQAGQHDHGAHPEARGGRARRADRDRAADRDPRPAGQAPRV